METIGSCLLASSVRSLITLMFKAYVCMQHRRPEEGTSVSLFMKCVDMLTAFYAVKDCIIYLFIYLFIYLLFVRNHNETIIRSTLMFFRHN